MIELLLSAEHHNTLHQKSSWDQKKDTEKVLIGGLWEY